MLTCAGVSVPRSRQDDAPGARGVPVHAAREAPAPGFQCGGDEAGRGPADCRVTSKQEAQRTQPAAVSAPIRRQPDIPSLSVSAVWATSPKNISQGPSSCGGLQAPALSKGKLQRPAPHRTTKIASASGPGSLFRSVSQGRMPDTSAGCERETGSTRKIQGGRASDCSNGSPVAGARAPVGGLDGTSLHRGTQAQQCACRQLGDKFRGGSGKASGRKARLHARERHGGPLSNRFLDQQPEEASEDVFKTWIAESERHDQLKNTGTDLPPRHLDHPFLTSLRSHPDNPLRFIEKQALASFSSFSPSLCSRLTSAAASGRKTPRLADSTTSSTTDAAVTALFNQVPKQTARHPVVTRTPRSQPLSGLSSAEDFVQMRTEFAVSRVLSALASRKSKKKRPASGPSTQRSRRSRLPQCSSASGERSERMGETSSSLESKEIRSPTQRDPSPAKKAIQPIFSPQRRRLTSRRLTGARGSVLDIPECPAQVEYSKPLFAFSDEKLNMPLEDFDDPDTYPDLSPRSWIQICAHRRKRRQSENQAGDSAGPPACQEPGSSVQPEEECTRSQSKQNLSSTRLSDEVSPSSQVSAKSPEEVNVDPSASRADKQKESCPEESPCENIPAQDGGDMDCWAGGDPSADSPEDAHVLHFLDGSWQMAPCWVLGYMESEKRYRVRLKGNGKEKDVRRLALQFVEEDPKKCQGRAEGCRKRRDRMRLRQGLINLIHRLPDSDFYPFSAPSRQKVLKRLLLPKGRGRLVKPDPHVVQQLLKELEDLYLFSMKYAAVRHKTITLNGTPHAFLSLDTLHSKFGSLFLPLLPPRVKTGGYDVPAKEMQPISRTVALLKRSPLFAREDIARVSQTHRVKTLHPLSISVSTESQPSYPAAVCHNRLPQLPLGACLHASCSTFLPGCRKRKKFILRAAKQTLLLLGTLLRPRG